jgi:hypothetical protein
MCYMKEIIIIRTNATISFVDTSLSTWHSELLLLKLEGGLDFY